MKSTVCAQRGMRGVSHLFRSMSSANDAGSSVLIFGSSTGVGKTIVSAGLSRAALHASRKVCYIKPVQTGDMDQYFVKFYTNPEGVRDIHFRTLRHWIAGYNGPVDRSIGPDKAIVDEIIQEIDIFESTLPLAEGASSRTSGVDPFCVVETAGGVLSPGPNQSLQADMYRPLHLPVVLVGDSGLGGISGTLCALEALQRRNYTVKAIVFVDKPCSDKLQNMSHVQHQLLNGFLNTTSCAQVSDGTSRECDRNSNSGVSGGGSNSGVVSTHTHNMPAIINLSPLPQNSQQLLFDWFKVNSDGFAALFHAMQTNKSN